MNDEHDNEQTDKEMLRRHREAPSASVGLYQCTTCFGPSGGPGQCLFCLRANPARGIIQWNPIDWQKFAWPKLTEEEMAEVERSVEEAAERLRADLGLPPKEPDEK
jgi:hypothetical protein